MTLPDLLIPTYVQMLGALSAWLGKAETQRPGGGAEALLAARIAPDMFPLSTQVRFACVQAQEGIFRLRGQDFPASVGILLDEGRNAAEHPGSIEDARKRIAETIALVEQAAANMPAVDPAAPVAHALPQGMVFDLTAEQYARDWTLPQFYFHVMTAYTILRGQGIELGKADYVAHMFSYLRPDTLPSQQGR
ncbi:hypothetical protein SAMN05216548_103113 [Faunimonas pinastri]|uniref:DUF1993 domain-containing protein n=2 Tax=Faunimonas pinastri TaxID=1855383 RepID=A0A1H9EA63_9HYPH|nr:hypothetical protein SAMN05216548_103113 [Faunimonas pinastri]